jgi:hypothetical protein
MPEAAYGQTLKAQDAFTAGLGQTFRSSRERAGVTLNELASGIGIALYLIRRHEAGALMLRTDKLIAAARYMRVAPASLLKATGEL